MGIQKKHIIIFLLLCCLFYCDKLILGPFASVRIHDSFDADFSRYTPAGELLLKNGLFAWNPKIICGMPAYAYQFPPYYLLCLFSLISPPWVLYTALTILLMFIAACGMYYFLKDFLKISTALSFLGGLVFLLETQIQDESVVHLVFNYAFPAFFMCLIAAGSENASLKDRMLSAAFVLFILSLSYPVLTFPIFFILQCLVIIFMDFDNTLPVKKMLFKTILLWAGYVLLLAPVIYSLYAFIPFAQRSYGPYAAARAFLSNFPGNFIQTFLQYAKSSCLFLLIIGLSPLLFYSRKVRKISAVLALVIAAAAFFQKPLPDIIRGTILEKMDLTHLGWTVPFLLAVFVIVGLEEFFRIKVAKAFYILSFLTAGLLLIYFMMIPGGTTPALLLNITVPLFVSVFCLIQRSQTGKRKLLLLSFILLGVVMMAQFKVVRLLQFEKYPYKGIYEGQPVFDRLKKESDRSPFRVATMFSLPTIMQHYGLETVETRAPVMAKTYKEFFREIIRPQLQTEKQRSHFDTYWYNLYLRDGDIIPLTERRDNSEGLFNRPLLLMANTKYIISRYRDQYLVGISERVIEAKSDNLIRPDLRAGMLRLFFKKADEYIKKPCFKKMIPNRLANLPENSLFEKAYCPTYFVYQLKDRFERGYLVPNAVLLGSDAEVLDNLSSQPLESLKNNAFLLKRDVAIDRVSSEKRVMDKDDRVALTYYGPDKLIFEGKISSPRILVITNNYHPDWKAILNGREENLYRANHTFQAVFLDRAGNFNVTLLYKDPRLWKMHWLVLVGLALIVYAAFKPYNKRT